MGDITQIKGFFYIEGSRDYPNGHSPNENFGFDDESETAVFNYSINDVEKMFSDPIIINGAAKNVDNGSQNNLIIERSFPEGILDETLYSDPGGAFWQRLLNTLEFLSMNQAAVLTAPTEDGYENIGDENLGNPASTDYYEPWYQKGSLIGLSNAENTRLQYVKFNFRRDDYDNYIPITIWMMPGSIDLARKFKVYSYVDSDVAEQGPEYNVDSVEFQTRIMEMVFDILKKGQYRRMDLFSPTRVYNPGEVDELVTQEDFYLFSNYPPEDDIDSITIKTQVKTYIQKELHLDVSFSDLCLMYPDLFEAGTVVILPLYNNEVGGNVVHPISIKRLNAIIGGNGALFSNATKNSDRLELFYIGSTSPGGTELDNRFRFPIICFETDNTSGGYLLGNIFPSYRPLYGSSYDADGEPWEIWHYLILISVTIGAGQLDFTSFSSTPEGDTIVDKYYMSAEYDGDSLEKISFTFNSRVWEVYAN